MTAISSTSTNQPIVFILDNVTDHANMADGLYANYEVHVLSADGDALAQMASYLEGRTGIEAIHLVSHGQAGVLDLGSVALSSSNLAEYGSSLSVIQGSLSQDADFLIYGCDVGQGAVGAEFVAALAQATGADVAASDNVTGPVAHGGDAVLEVQTGSIEATALDAGTFQSSLGPDGLLSAGLSSSPYVFNGADFQIRIDAAISDTDPENAFLPGSNADRFLLSNVSDGTTVSAYMGNSFGLNDLLQVVRGGAVLTQDDDSGAGQLGQDAYLSWTYQAGDIVQATSTGLGERGTYSLFIGAANGPVPVASILDGAASVQVLNPTYAIVEDGASSGWTDGGGSLSGTLTLANADPTGVTFSVNGPAVTGDGGDVIVIAHYGTLYLNPSSGNYSYVPSVTAVDALGDGQNGVDTFTFNAVGGSGDITSGSFSFQVTGSNDAPLIVLEAATATLVEAGGQANGEAGRETAQMGIQISDAEGYAGLDTVKMTTEDGWSFSDDGLQLIHLGTYGTAYLTIASGNLAYELDNTLVATQALTTNDAPSESFVIHVLDLQGAAAQTTAVFSIQGADDEAALSISEALTPEYYTDGNGLQQPNFNRSGQLSVIDVDTDVQTYGAVNFGITGGAMDDGGNSMYTGNFGMLVVNASTGQYNYVANTTAIASVAGDAHAYDVFDLTMSGEFGLAGIGVYQVEIVGVYPEVA